MKPIISICIPSYNRPRELFRLLKSIDCNTEDAEIIICEDKSPARTEIADVVQRFKLNCDYLVKYFENEINIGYDANLRNLVDLAEAEFIIFMGDDDEFVPGALNEYISFLKENAHLGYVLKTSRTVHKDGSIEEFRYYKETTFFEPGLGSMVTLFRKSVFISGFTIKNLYAKKHKTELFDSSLLYQLYLLAETVLHAPSAYCSIMLTQQYEGGTPYFGSSEVEKGDYTPGTITIDNSVKFIEKFFLITDFLDEKYNFNSTEMIKKDMSRYSYPILAIQREKGIKDFNVYYKRLKNIGLDCTKYFYIYYFGLLIFGKSFCDRGIQTIKKKLGRSPSL